MLVTIKKVCFMERMGVIQVNKHDIGIGSNLDSTLTGK
jgi:hypothetical protein